MAQEDSSCRRQSVEFEDRLAGNLAPADDDIGDVDRHVEQILVVDLFADVLRMLHDIAAQTGYRDDIPLLEL